MLNRCTHCASDLLHGLSTFQAQASQQSKSPPDTDLTGAQFLDATLEARKKKKPDAQVEAKVTVAAKTSGQVTVVAFPAGMPKVTNFVICRNIANYAQLRRWSHAAIDFRIASGSRRRVLYTKLQRGQKHAQPQPCRCLCFLPLLPLPPSRATSPHKSAVQMRRIFSFSFFPFFSSFLFPWPSFAQISSHT